MIFSTRRETSKSLRSKDKHPRNNKKDTARRGERGNVFFTLFGAVAVVGVLGAGIMATMRGPLSTMVDVNRIEQAKSEMRVGLGILLQDAADIGDGDALTEPAEPQTCTSLSGNGGCVPFDSGAPKNDPWGNPYKYCGWNNGSDTSSSGNILEGGATATNIAVAMLSSGPDGSFDNDCEASTHGTDPYVPSQSDADGDDLIVSMTYSEAVSGSGGLWTAATTNDTSADVATIDRDIDLTGNTSTGFSAQLRLGASSMLLPTDSEVTTCSSANDLILRIDESGVDPVIQLCDGDNNTWLDAGGGLWTANGSDIYYNTGNVGINVLAPDDALDVDGTAQITGNTVIGGTLGVTGATTLSSTLGVTGATTLLSTLDAQGDISDSAGDLTIDDNLVVTGTSDLQGSVSDSGGVLTFADDIAVTGTSDLQGTVANSTGDVTIGDNIVVTGTSDLQGDISDSVGDLTIDDNLVVTGTSDLQGNVSNSSGDLILDDDVQITGTLDVTSTADFNGDVLVQSDDSIIPPTDCTDADEKLYWDTNGWNCHDIGDGGTGDGLDITSNELADLSDVNDSLSPSQDDCFVYDSGSWTTKACNELGLWEEDTNVIRIQNTGYYSAVDFVFGSATLADAGDATHDTRFFFDKSQAAFAAGTVTSTEWDAPGYASVALGQDVSVTADNSFAFGLGDATGVSPVVSGTNSFGVFMGDQSAVDLTATNTFGVIGGQILIDDDGTTGSQGCLRYNNTDSVLEYSDDCSTWVSFTNDISGLWTDLGDGRIYYGTDPTTEFVGIGTNDPQATLDVNGGIRLGTTSGSSPNFMAVNDLSDVTVSSVADGECLVYSAADTEWQNIDCSTAASDAGKWDDGVDANDIAYTSGFVGIGTTDPDISLAIVGTDAILIPVGTAAQQPSTPSEGMIRYNSDTDVFEGYVDDGTPAWEAINTGVGGKWADGDDLNDIAYTLGYVGIGTTDPDVSLAIVGTDAVLLPVGTAAQQPSTPSEGMIRYNSDTDVFEGYVDDGTPAWEAINTGVGGKWVDGSDVGEIYYDTDNVGIGTTDPEVALHVDGTLMIANGGELCTGTYAGAIRYYAGGLDYCDGTSWKSVSVSGSSVDLQITPTTDSTMNIDGSGCGTPPCYGTTVTFTVTNNGAVTTDPLSYTLEGDSVNFDVVGDTCTGVTLASAATCEFDIRPVSSVNDTYAATLTVPHHATPIATLSGTATNISCTPGSAASGGIVVQCDYAGTGKHLVINPKGCASTSEPSCSGSDTLQKYWASGSSFENIHINAEDGGDGDQNHANIIAYSANSSSYPAAQYCQDFVLNGETDWFLPAVNELVTAVSNVPTELDAVEYWTSHNNFNYRAYTVDGASAAVDAYNNKNTLKHVRCMRIVDEDIPTPVADGTPESFSFSSAIAASAGVATASPTSVTITGITNGTSISIGGDTGAEYRINSGSWTSAAGTVKWNDIIEVRVDSAAELAKAKATLTVGAVSADFNVITECASCTADKRVFVTSSTYSGNLGGLSGADAKCQASADAAGLGGTWMSILGGTGESAWAINRIDYNWDRLVNMNGDVIATSMSDLWDGSIANPINIDENGTTLSGAGVWAGSDQYGSQNESGTSRTCDGWTTTGNNSHYGYIGDTGSSWINKGIGGTGACNSGNAKALYCLEVTAGSVTLTSSPSSATAMDVTGPGSPATGAEQVFTITNTGSSGSGTLTYTLSNGTNFAVTTDTCSGNTLAASATCSMGITPQASANGTYIGTLTVEDGSNGLSVAIGMDGTATGFAGDAGADELNDLYDATTDYTTYYNFALGEDAGDAITTGTNNSFIGFNAGTALQTGDNNTSLGYMTLLNADGMSNSTAIGSAALANATSGSNNTAVGYNALNTNVSGSNNTALGAAALRDVTASNNVAIGFGALSSAGAAGQNIAIGVSAGDNLINGSGNIIIGYDIDAPAISSSNYLNIGDVIEGDLSSGFIGINNPAANVALDVVGSIEYTGTLASVSDKRLKDNIAELEAGTMLERLSQLKGYSYTFKDDETKHVHLGVMAQELETLFPELVNTADDEMHTKTVNYIGLIAPLLEATKELKAENDALKSELEQVKTAQSQTNDVVAKLDAQVDLLSKIASTEHTNKASMQSLLLLLMGLFGGAALSFMFLKRRNA